jgi:hypothetical protein
MQQTPSLAANISWIVQDIGNISLNSMAYYHYQKSTLLGPILNQVVVAYTLQLYFFTNHSNIIPQNHA